jgi:hypothetical protein
MPAVTVEPRPVLLPINQSHSQPVCDKGDSAREYHRHASGLRAPLKSGAGWRDRMFQFGEVKKRSTAINSVPKKVSPGLSAPAGARG